MVNISKGLLGLAEGVDAQRDIGGLMFQEASRQEGRAYTEAMRKEAEERADLRQIATEARADERYAKRLEDEERIWFERAKETREGEMNLYVRQFGMESARQIKMFNMETMRQVRLALDKATSDTQRELIKTQGDQLDQISKQIIARHEHRPDDAKWNPDTKEWDDGGAWKDEVSALERKYNKAASNLGLTPLTEKVDKDKYGPHALQIYENLRQGRGGGNENWDDLMKSIAGDKESPSYKATLETIEGAINKFVNDPSSGYSQLTGATKSELRKAVLELFTVEGKGHVARSDDPGDAGAPPPADVSQALFGTTFTDESQQDFVDQINVDNISIDDIGLYEREFARYQDHGHPQLQAARVRDPSVLLPLLRKERANMLGEQKAAAGYGMPWTEDKIKRLAKVEEIIKKLESLDPSLIDRYERDPYGNILRERSNLDNAGASVSPQGGMLNRPGMIQMFESGPGLDMSAEAVRARTKGMARPEELA